MHKLAHFVHTICKIRSFKTDIKGTYNTMIPFDISIGTPSVVGKTKVVTILVGTRFALSIPVLWSNSRLYFFWLNSKLSFILVTSIPKKKSNLQDPLWKAIDATFDQVHQLHFDHHQWLWYHRHKLAKW